MRGCAVFKLGGNAVFVSPKTVLSPETNTVKVQRSAYRIPGKCATFTNGHSSAIQTVSERDNVTWV